MWHGHGPLSGRRSPDVFPLSVGWASPWRSGPSGHGFPPPGYASLREQWTRRHPWNWAEPPGPWASAAPPSGRTPFCHSCKEQQRMEIKRTGWKNSVVGPLGGKLFFFYIFTCNGPMLSELFILSHHYKTLCLCWPLSFFWLIFCLILLYFLTRGEFFFFFRPTAVSTWSHSTWTKQRPKDIDFFFSCVTWELSGNWISGV